MKNDITTTFLNAILALMVVLCVLFTFMYLSRTHDFRQMQARLQTRMQVVQANIVRAQALARDAAVYNETARNPELAQIIQRAMGTPAPPAPAK